MGGAFGGMGGQPRRRRQRPAGTLEVTLEDMYGGATQRVRLQMPVMHNGMMRAALVEGDLQVEPGARSGDVVGVEAGGRQVGVQLKQARRPRPVRAAKPNATPSGTKRAGSFSRSSR